MSAKITYRQVIARLAENDIPYGVLTLQNGVSVVIAQRGGRIFGPFLTEDSAGLYWINDAFAQPDSFKEFLASGNWNIGGDRVWIAPEIQYGVLDRDRYWETVHTPAQVDPGTYELDQPQPGWWRLVEDVTLEAHNLASGRKELRLERLIRQAEDPLRGVGGYEDLIDGVLFAGYEQVVTLSESKLDGIMSEAWSLVQLNPGGDLLIPASPRVEVVDYYDPIDDSLMTIYPHHVRLKVTGTRQYKIGIKAAHTFGRLGYYRPLAGGRAYLIVRSFFNNPSLPYIEEPAHRPGCRGHSIHVYNDNGMFGGFGELECNAQTIGGVTGRSSSTDQMLLWLYVGPVEKIEEIGLHLLGVEI